MQIDPKHVNGVTVATSTPPAASARRSNHPAVTTVSAFKITTSPAARANPSFTDRTNPRFSP